MKKLKSSNQGSSLVEIVLAVVILGIITVPLIRSFVVSAHTSKKSIELSDATVAAQSLIEELSAADMEELLKDTEVLSDKEYNLYLTEISGGSSKFDALVTISANNDDNEKPIGVYSEIDAMISIAGYDSIAESDYIAKCTPEPDEDGSVPVLSINELSRSITINASQKGNDYEVEVKVEYTGIGGYDYFQSYSDFAFIKGVSDPNSDEAAFSVFLIYNAYYKSSRVDENILIEKKNASNIIPDFNVFLVNTSEDTSNYTAKISYKNQHFKDDKAKSRVFTNFAPESAGYTAYAEPDGINIDKPHLSQYLVEERAKDRRYLISVHLYRAGEGPAAGGDAKSEPVFSLESKRLY